MFPRESEKRHSIFEHPHNSRPSHTDQYPTRTSLSDPDQHLLHHEIQIRHQRSEYRSSIERANFFSTLHFFFAVKLIRKANSFKDRCLKIADLEPIGESESCENLEKSFTKYYKRYSKKYPKNRRVMALTLFKIFKKNAFIQAFWQLLYALSRIMVAYFVYLIIYALRNSTSAVKDSYLAIIGLALCSIIAFYATNQVNFNSAYTVNKMQAGILGMLFRKINKLSLHSVEVLNLGKLINVVANDLNNLDRVHWTVSVVLAPFIVGAALGMLWYFWGVSSLVGIGYMMFMWVIQWSLACPTLKLRRGKTVFTDERIKGLAEMIGAVRLMKMYAWEWNCINTIEGIRTNAIKMMKKFNFVDSIARAFTFSSHWIACFLIYVTYTQVEAALIPSRTFATILILTLLRQTVEIQIFNCFIFVQEMKLLFTRIMSIMDLAEIPIRENSKPKPENSENSIEFEDFTAYWEGDNDGSTQGEGRQTVKEEEFQKPVLSNINLQIKKASLNIIVGQVASGKSSLLLSITNEIQKYTGTLRYQGSCTYVAQNPVLFYGPLRDSVTFGKAYDEMLFWRVLDACCLSDEVRKLPEKEMTEIGERGIILSGSQKVRLILARALYSEADIYLLDDPLIVLDAKLGKQVFKKAILEFLKDKTVLMITHRFYFLKYSDRVIIMNKGRILEEGSYQELAQKEILVEHQHRLNEAKAKESHQEKAENKPLGIQRSGSLYQREDRPPLRVLKSELAGAALDEGLYIEDERLDDGNVTLKVYLKYLKTMFTKWNFIPLVFLFLGPENIAWLFLIMVSKWARGVFTDTQGMIVVGSLAVGGLFLHLFKFLLYYNATLNASRKFHNKMLRGVFLSSIKFFDKNSLGRILSRFSNEIGILDKFLIGALLDVLEGICQFFSYLFALWILEPYILIPAAVGAVLYVIVYLWCRKALNQTRGLELMTRGPLYSLFLIGAEGLTIIRASRQTEALIRSFYNKVDDHSRANIAYLVSVRFMTFVINYAIELIVIATFCVFIPVPNTPLSRGYFINILTLLPTTMQWILQNFVVLDLIMSSVARVINFCENRDRKGLLKLKQYQEGSELKKENWPMTGDINVQNVNMRCTHKSERLLKDLSFNIKTGEKVAVVCGSRAGISRIVYLLLRLFEIDKTEVNPEEQFVKIDGVNIKDLEFETLRKAVLVIPQRTYIFSGTIRKNLDLWNKHSDEEIWRVLEHVKLKDYVENLKEKLDTKLGRGLSVFSAGQKDLLTIARAMLRGGKIIIQDEATTHVDLTTNQDVQKNIVKMYKDSTLITVTHRLFDIAEYDKVLLLKDGERIEFDEPYRLLAKDIGDEEITNKEGAFSSVVRSLGAELSDHFMKLSKKHYYKKHGLLEVEKSD